MALLDLKTGKPFSEPSARSVLPLLTRRKTLAGLAGILATSCAPSVLSASTGRGIAGSAKANVARGMMRNVGARQAAMGGAAWTNPYVTDGLLCMHDGEWNAGGGIHSDSATSWLDLSGNGLNATRASYPYPTWGSNYTEVDESTGRYDYYGCWNAIPTTQNTKYYNILTQKGYTLEIVCYVNTNRKYVEYLLSGFNYSGFFGTWYGKGLAYYAHSGDSYWGGKLVGTLSGQTNWGYNHYAWILKNEYIGLFGAQISVDFENVKTRIYCDGIKKYECDGAVMTGLSYDRWNFAPVGSNYNNKTFCCRLYQRPLSESEIAANYAIDKARFNLP